MDVNSGRNNTKMGVLSTVGRRSIYVKRLAVPSAYRLCPLISPEGTGHFPVLPCCQSALQDLSILSIDRVCSVCISSQQLLPTDPLCLKLVQGWRRISKQMLATDANVNLGHADCCSSSKPAGG